MAGMERRTPTRRPAGAVLARGEPSEPRDSPGQRKPEGHAAEGFRAARPATPHWPSGGFVLSTHRARGQECSTNPGIKAQARGPLLQPPIHGAQAICSFCTDSGWRCSSSSQRCSSSCWAKSRSSSSSTRARHCWIAGITSSSSRVISSSP